MVLFNAALVSADRMDGLNRYAQEILRHIDKSRFIFAANRKVIDAFGLTQYMEVPEHLSLPTTKGNLARLIWNIFELPGLADACGAEAVYCPFPEGSLSKKVPQIITVHDLLTLLYPECYPRLKLYFQFILPLVLRASRSVISISESTKKDIARFFHYKKPVRVILNGGNFQSADVSEDEKARVFSKYELTKYVLFVSENRPYKNLRGAIEGFSLLEDKTIQLSVVGKLGESAEEYRQQALELGLENRVKFLGFVSDSDLKALYAGAKVLLFPSLYEGFGFPPLEAFAFGCPVAASDRASIPEVCGDAAVYLNPDEPASIAGAVELLLNSPALREENVQKGYARLKEFDWNKTVLEILNTIDLLKK